MRPTLHQKREHFAPSATHFASEARVTRSNWNKWRDIMTIAGRQAEIGYQKEESLTPQARRAIWGAFIGFFVDNYDIFLPVIALAPAIAYFIPSTLSPTTAAVASAMIFATTLIGRPLGAFIFGHYADTLGRKRTTVVAV